MSRKLHAEIAGCVSVLKPESRGDLGGNHGREWGKPVESTSSSQR